MSMRDKIQIRIMISIKPMFIQISLKKEVR